MPLIFAVGLPIGLAKQAQGRACLAVMVSFLTWNYFINAMGMTWGSYFGVDFTQDAVAGSGLTMMAGIKTPRYQHYRRNYHFRHCDGAA